MDQTIKIIVENGKDDKTFNVSIAVPTAFGTEVVTGLARNLDGRTADEVIRCVKFAYAAIGILAEEEE